MAFQHDDDDDEDIMATSEQLEFWGTIIKAGQSVRVDIDEEDEEHVSLSLVALGEEDANEKKTKTPPHAIVSVVEDVGVNGAKEIFLATLRRGNVEQFSLDVVLSDTFIMKNSGNVDVHVTGWRMDGRVRGGIDKEMEEYEDEEMEDEMFEDMAAERAMMDTSSSDSEEDDADFASEDEETDEDLSDGEEDFVELSEDEIDALAKEAAEHEDKGNESGEEDEEESDDEDDDDNRDESENEESGEDGMSSDESESREESSDSDGDYEYDERFDPKNLPKDAELFLQSDSEEEKMFDEAVGESYRGRNASRIV